MKPTKFLFKISIISVLTLSHVIPVEKKLEWMDKLIDAGLKRLQITAFVNPRYVPQMAL